MADDEILDNLVLDEHERRMEGPQDRPIVNLDRMAGFQCSNCGADIMTCGDCGEYFCPECGAESSGDY